MQIVNFISALILFFYFMLLADPGVNKNKITRIIGIFGAIFAFFFFILWLAEINLFIEPLIIRPYYPAGVLVFYGLIKIISYVIDEWIALDGMN